MKKTLRSITLAILCVIIAIVGIGADAVCAAKKLPTLKVTFNGISINMIEVGKDGNEEVPTAEAVVEKWGEPDKKEQVEEDPHYTWYAWEDGKTTIGFMNYQPEDGDAFLCHFGVSLGGKNDEMCGIKVGMKKEKVLKKLKKTYGKNNVCLAKEGQSIHYKKGKPVPKGKPTGDGEWISVSAYSYVLGLTFFVKDGKISSMGFSS